MVIADQANPVQAHPADHPLSVIALVVQLVARAFVTVIRHNPAGQRAVPRMAEVRADPPIIIVRAARRAAQVFATAIRRSPAG
jgi:hypothetical protein